MNKRESYILITGLIILITLILAIAIYARQNRSRPITFAECEEIGGVAWRVDLYHPDICSSCAEYRECEALYNDYRDLCPDCYGPCQECQDGYSLYESCPECYGPCQNCQNKYLNEFKDDEERYRLCPECKICTECREQLNDQVMNCPACVSCNQCKEGNKKYSDITEVCPQIHACGECMEGNSPYPDKCPNGEKKIGEISDAAIWFQCCR